MKKWIVRGLIALVALLVVVVIAVTLMLDRIVKHGVETFGPQLAKVSVTLESAKISLLTGGGGVNGLVVGNPEGYKTANAISVGHASLSLQPSSLFSDKVVIKHIRVESPEITFEGGIKENNLSKILDNLNAAAGTAAKPTEPQPAGPGKKLQVDDFLIRGAKVNISLSGMGGRVIPVTLPEIHLTNLGTGPDGITAAEMFKRALNEIVAAATQAATSDAIKNVSHEATEAVKDVGGKATEAIKGVGDLFKKK